jgi:hypothetical protein
MVVSDAGREDGPAPPEDAADEPAMQELTSPRDGGPSADSDTAGQPDVLETETVGPPPAELALNEIDFTGKEWVELHNLSDEHVSQAGGWAISTLPGDPKRTFVIPDGTPLLPGEFLVLKRQTDTEDGFPFDIGHEADPVRLLRPDGGEVDSVKLPLIMKGITYGRLPDGTGAWAETIPTQGLPNLAAPDLDEVLYNPFKVAQIEITLPESSVEAILADPRTYAQGQIAIALVDSTATVLDVGIRLKGKYGSFRQLDAKAAFKVKFGFLDDEQRFLGLKKLTLNNLVQDPSMIHEAAAYRIFRAFGVPAPTVGYAWVRVNGQDYGLYLIVETPDDVFLSRHFPATAHLYEGEYGTDVVPGSADAFQVDEGDEADITDLLALIDTAANPDDGSWVETLSANAADFDEMLRMWAVEQYIGHWDGYAPTINNYFLHSDPEGRFSMLPWGTDQTFGDFRSYHDGWGYLFARCMSMAACRLKFDQTLGSLLPILDSLASEEFVTELAAFLDPYVEADPRKPYSYDDSKAHVEWTLGFLADRRIDAANALACTLDPNLVDKDGDGFVCDGDCDDSDPFTYHGAYDACGDGKDQDCNGIPDDAYECPDCKEVFRGPHRYLVCPVYRPFAEAPAHCQEVGAQLVILDDPLEEKWVRKQLELHGIGEAWIGMDDTAEEGHFVWWDGTEPEYVNWNPGEPNDWGGNEDCVQLITWAQWNDLDCAAAQAIVCEDVCKPGEDQDKDGYPRCGSDCDDGNKNVNPGAKDVCGDMLDQDCSLVPDDGKGCSGLVPLTLDPPIDGAAFMLGPTAKDRESARAVCQGEGADANLAWFLTLEEAASVRAAADKLLPCSELWIGLQDQEQEGEYSWADGATAAFFNWADGQPNNGNGSGEQDCCRLLGDGKWNDTDCSLEFPFLCRMELQ